MSSLHFQPITTDQVIDFQNGALDFNSQMPEHHTSTGFGNPCRHCLSDIDAGEPMLLLSYLPFKTIQPYAEKGPILLHANACKAWGNTGDIPSAISDRETLIIRGYDKGERIVGGTGRVIASKDFEKECLKTFANNDVTHIHVRSATNNCYFCKVERGFA